MRVKVLQLSTWETACGIADYTASLRTALVDCGVDVDVWPVDRVENNYRSQEELQANYRAFTEAAADYDVVHVQHEFSFFAGSYGAKTSLDVYAGVLRRLRRTSAGVLTTFNTHPRAIEPEGRRRFGLVTGQYFRAIVGSNFRGRRATSAIAHNRLTRRALIDRGVSAQQITVIPIGLPEFAPVSDAQRSDAKRALGLPPLGVVLGMFGFLTETKGHMTALRAMKALPPDYSLLIVGGPHPHAPSNPLDEMLAWLQEHPDVSNRVLLAGYADAARVDELLAAVDVHLAPYDVNPILSSSAALTRAMASGRPIVASRIPAFLELNETAPECVAMCTPNAPFELAHAVQEVIGDDARAKQLVMNAEAFTRRHSWRASAEQHVQLYERLAP